MDAKMIFVVTFKGIPMRAFTTLSDALANVRACYTMDTDWSIEQIQLDGE